MRSVRVGEIMIPLDDYPHVPYWFTLRQVMAIMEKAEIERDGRRSLPRIVLVFDQAYRLMGMAQRRDILRGLESQFLAKAPDAGVQSLFGMRVDPNLSELSHETLVEAMRERAEQPVREVMQPIRATVDHDDHIMKAISQMVEHDMSLLPVLRDRKVVGVVRSVEVFHEAAKVVL